MNTQNIENLFRILSLHDDDGTSRRHAALTLGSTRGEGIAERLVEAIAAEPDAHVREDLTWAIVQHAEAAEPHLLDMLTSDDHNRRFTAAHVLSKVGNPDHFEHVAPLVADEQKDVALKAYRAAANTGGSRAVDVLAARLGDGDDWQRDALSTAMSTLGADAVPALVQALSDGDTGVREHAAEALGHMGGPEADGAAEALEKSATDSEAAVRLMAVSALGQLGFVADEPLRRLSSSEDTTVAAVAKRFVAEREAADSAAG